MKNANLTKQKHTDARAFAFTHLGAKSNEQSLNISPMNGPIHWAGKDELKRGSMTFFHEEMVS